VNVRYWWKAGMGFCSICLPDHIKTRRFVVHRLAYRVMLHRQPRANAARADEARPVSDTVELAMPWQDLTSAGSCTPVFAC
jgi:hypothetical protein